MAFHPYLFFSGTCRQAFTRYQEIFGGQLDVLTVADMPPEVEAPTDQQDLVMHAALTSEHALLMGSDDPTGDGGPMKGVAVHCEVPDVDEATRVFGALADGGEVTMPLSATFWSPMFGMCVDRFGTPWMVSAAPTAGQ
jgi:PhnB protein